MQSLQRIFLKKKDFYSLRQRLGRTGGASLLSLQNTKIPISFPLPSKKIRKKILQTENNPYFR
jgi:hypothetical protein